MRTLALASAALTLALVGCSEPAPKPKAETGQAVAQAVLAGVDLNQPVQATGTEPFWGVEITPTTLIYTSPDGAPLSGSNTGPDLQGTTAIYTTTAGDRPLVVTLIATECSDGMSDRTYPLTAVVKLGEATLSGCAAAKAALAAASPGL
jgi:uncharacterized membrane protein